MNCSFSPSTIPISIDGAILLIESDDRDGIGNTWRRARVCRRLKHVELSDEQKARCLKAILNRLKTGAFTQQFESELTLAVCLDPELCLAIATPLQNHPKQYIAKYATWLLNKIEVRARCTVPVPGNKFRKIKRPRYCKPDLIDTYQKAEAARKEWYEVRWQWAQAKAWRMVKDERMHWISLQQAKERLRIARENLRAKRRTLC